MKKKLLLFYCFNILTSLTGFAQLGEVNHWETLVNGKEDWHYYSDYPTIDSAWKYNTFNDSTWLIGPGGIGFGNLDDSTVTTVSQSLFLRKKFYITDTSQINQLLIQAHFDDGFVAYLNGFEVMRQNMFNAFSTVNYLDTAEIFHVSKLSQGKKIEDFIIDKAQLHYIIQNGANTFSIQVHNVNNDTTGLTALFYLHAGMKDSSVSYQLPPVWFENPPVFDSHTNLPVVKINSLGQLIGDSAKITATMKITFNGIGNLNGYTDSANHFNGFIGIENRGQSSLEFTKHSYSLETRDSLGQNLNVSLLGLPAENDWILYARYSDKTLMRNDFTYNLWRKMGNYTARTKFCELFVNDRYMGVYLLTEKLKIDKNRVNISKLTPADTVGDELTGGYIIKNDKKPVLGQNAWYSTIPPFKNFTDIYFQYADPISSKLDTIQKLYIINFIDSIQHKLVDTTNTLDSLFINYLDKNSAIDKLLITEFSKDVDSYKFSQYMYKDKNSKGGNLKFGLIWDVDLGYGNVNYGPQNAYQVQNWLYSTGGNSLFWFDRMMDDNNFKCDLVARWENLRNGTYHLDSLFSMIDSTALYLNTAQKKNHYYWNTLGRYVWPNFYVGETYADEIVYFKNWIENRMLWMGNELFTYCVSSNINNSVGRGEDNITSYPNPFSNIVTFKGKYKTEGPINLTIYNVLGELVFSKTISENNNDIFFINWQAVDFKGYLVPDGIYFYKIHTRENVIGSGKIIKN